MVADRADFFGRPTVNQKVKQMGFSWCALGIASQPLPYCNVLRNRHLKFFCASLRRLLGAVTLALLAWFAPTVAETLDIPADLRGVPADLPLGVIKTVNSNWQPDDCTKSEREQVVCTISAFIACQDFFRRDLCDRVGLYPALVPEQDYVLYGKPFVEGDDVRPDIRQYRLLEFRNLDDRYSPPILLVHVDARACWHTQGPLNCGAWEPEYVVISSLDTAEPNVAAWGVMSTWP